MRQSETVLDKDAEIRRLLEERREERNQKMQVRLGRNLSNPLSVSSWEALTGTLKSKKAPTSAVKEPVQAQIEKEVKPKVSSWDALRGSLKNKKGPVKATTVTKPNEAVAVKGENAAKSESRPIKRTLSFGQTATSLKRTNLANGGATLKRATSFKSIPTSAKKPVAPPATQLTSVQKQKLTVPCSPNFTNRTKQQTAAIKSVPVASSTKPVAVSKRAPVQVPRSFQPISSSSEKALDTAESVPEVINKRKSSSWMIPLTPERKASPSKTGPNAQHIPNVKPFIRKSFSESKTASNRSVQIDRSVSSVSMIRPSTSTLPRKSVAPSLLGNDSSRRSVWGVSKEPSEKEKVQHWLEKRGRSVVSCRHLGCLGYKIQDFKVPKRKSNSVKSIRTGRLDVTGSVEGSVCASPILLKRKSSVMNTTFEKGDDDEQRVLTAPPQPDFDNEIEEVAHSPRFLSIDFGFFFFVGCFVLAGNTIIIY